MFFQQTNIYLYIIKYLMNTSDFFFFLKIFNLDWCDIFSGFFRLCVTFSQCVNLVYNFFLPKASALRADAFYKSICPYVCWYVCLSVCLLTFEVPFKHISPPLLKVKCPKLLEIRNPWGKLMERSGLRFDNFY